MDRLHEGVEVVRGRSGVEPRVTLVLGPGMEPLADAIDVEADVPCAELAGLPDTGAGSAGRLLIGRLDGEPVAALQGALHSYEGHRRGAAATFLVRVLRLLGPSGGDPPALLLAGTCGTVSDLWGADELALVDDHINLLGENPLMGPNLDALGPRFPDMSEPYDRALQALAVEAALERRVPLRRAVYVAVTGPERPTRAERRMLRWMGGDLFGTWVAPEVVVARHMGMRVLALLAVTEAGRPSVPAEPSSTVLDHAAAILTRVAGGAA
jgi:purine-nucleoside phosphorylase